MATDYAPRHFLRHAHIDLLRRYFTKRERLNDLPWDRLNGSHAEIIHESWNALPVTERYGIENDFLRIHRLGTEDGTRSIVDEGWFHQLDLKAELDAIDGHVNKALWTFLEYPEVFRVAGLMNRADHLNSRYWRKRKGMPAKQPNITATARKELEQAIAAYYWEKEGRGSPCHVDAYLRGDRYHYLFAYPRDYADMFLGFGADGEFEQRLLNPAFEVIFCFDPGEGTLDLFVRGDKKTGARSPRVVLPCRIGGRSRR